MQRIIDTLERKLPNEYIKNVEYLEKLLTQKQINYLREFNSNTFVIDKPSDSICKKYQLSNFKDNNGNDKAHIIIFPSHKQKIIKELVEDLIQTHK